MTTLLALPVSFVLPLLLWGQVLALEIQFQDQFDCEDSFRHRSYCLATKPQTWSDEDKKLVLEAIEEWPEEAQVVIPPQVKIYRMSFGYRARSAFSYKRKQDVYAWVEHPKKIFITDLFINNRKIIEGGSVSFRSYIMLHEMAHLFDRQRINLSRKADFLALYGWAQVEDPNPTSRYILKKWIMEDVDQKELAAKREHLTSLMNQGQTDEAARQSLEFAASYGLPTMYSTLNPAECFAELVTNYLLAPQLNQQIKPQALQWLEDMLMREGFVKPQP